MRSVSSFQLSPSLKQSLRAPHEKKASYWEKGGERMVMRLFRHVAKTVPAYQQLLKAHTIDQKEINTVGDIKNLPIIDKESYLRKFDFIDLFSNRDISKATTISATSGSSGEPFYFPRGEEQDSQYEYVAEHFLRNQFDIHRKKTLGIIGFGLGIWIGGIFTYKVFNKIASKGNRLTLAPVGSNLEYYIKIIKKFGDHYDQILLMGYPPFVKDIIDEGEEQGIRWARHSVRILTAAEGFSENFREYLAKKTSIANSFRDIINMYGTVELGTMAHETAFANLIRKIAVENENVFQRIFPGANHEPTLAQYYPQMVYFENYNGEVIASGIGSSIPLVRYRFHDLGGVISFNTMVELLQEEGVHIMKEARKAKIDKMIIRLPFVYVYGKSDHTIILRGANIYPLEIRIALHAHELEDCVTGKYSMTKKEDKRMNEYLEINVELKKGVEPSTELKGLTERKIVETLLRKNSEFSYLYALEPKKVMPKIIFTNHGEKEFQLKGKHHWIK